MLARASVSAASGIGSLFKGASGKVVALRQHRKVMSEVPRKTAPPPSGALATDGRHFRRQSAPDAAPAAAPEGYAAKLKDKRTRKIAVAAALAVLVSTVVVLATRGPGEPLAAKEPAGSEPAAKSGEPLPAAEAKKLAPVAAAAGAMDPKTGIVADVPLFGPTSMTTLEPAPLGPAPDLAAEPAANGEEAREMAAAKASVPDEAFEDEPRPKSQKKANPSQVAPWGRGKVRMPTIHRLRLDAPGGAIQGATDPTGFTVLVPGRKVMESGKPISKRDKRIARVRTSNTSGGAQVAFQFRDGVPAYRVRLRKDYVEFLISAPQKSPKSRDKNAAKSRSATKKR
jgi:hypothetical protein